MARYLLDTTVLIDLSKGVPRVREQIDELLASGHSLGVSAVTVSEFMAGVPPHQRPRWGRLIHEFAYWDTTRNAAELAGMLRYDLARRGITVHLADSLIAGLAIVLEAVVLTDNPRDFAHAGVSMRRLRT